MTHDVANPRSWAHQAYRWIFGGSLVSALLAAFLQPRATFSEFDAALAAANIFTAAICLSPASAAAGVLLFALGTGATQRMARLFGGTGTYAELAHTFAAYQAPIAPVLVLAFIALSSGPTGGVGPLILLLAGLALCAANVASIRAVNRFGWGEAVITQALVTAAAILLGAILFFSLTVLAVFASQAASLQAP